MNEYTRGELIRTTVLFKAPDVNGVLQLTDPTAVNFEYRTPQSGTTTLATYGVGPVVIKDTTGTYHADIPTAVETGEYWYRWEGTGACQTAVESSFYIPRGNL